MSGLLFVPQAQLDEWLQSGEVDVTAEGLKLLATGELLPLEAAYHFLAVLDGEDATGLLRRVKTERQLRELGAEPYSDSVLLGEVVYQVSPGFLARTPAPSGLALQQGGAALKDAGGDAIGAERLAEFF